MFAQIFQTERGVFGHLNAKPSTTYQVKCIPSSSPHPPDNSLNRRHLAHSLLWWTFQYHVAQRNVSQSRLNKSQLPLLDDLAPGFRGVEEVLQVVISHNNAVRFFGKVEQKPEQYKGCYISVLPAYFPYDRVLETSSQFGQCCPQRVILLATMCTR